MIAKLGSLRRLVDEQIGAVAGADASARSRLCDLALISFGTGIAGLAAFPVWLALGAGGSGFAVLTFAWLLAPLGIAGYLVHSGHLVRAHALFSIGAAGLATTVTAYAGGLGSAAILSFILGPLVAAGAGNRIALIAALAAAFAGIAVLVTLDAIGGILPPVTLSPWAAALISVVVLGLAAARIGRLAAMPPEAPSTAFDFGAHATELVTLHGIAGSVERASAGALAVFGLKAMDLMGDGLLRLIPRGERPRYLTAVSDALRGTEATVAYHVENPDGEDDLWVETVFRPVVVGGSRKAVGVTRAIAERRRLEVELAAARDALAVDAATRGRFLAEISHELRTPLNSIVGFSEILASDQLVPFDAGRWRDYARLIGTSGEHLLEVVNDLLDVAQIEAGRFPITRTAFDVEDLIAECVGSLQPQAGRRSLAFTTEIAADLPAIDGDRRACRQILVNLLANALKFSDPCSTVVVSALAEGGMLRFRVADRGRGIAPEDIVKLGSPFFQTNSAYTRRNEGTGLGLSVVKGLVALHGGELVIRSEVGAGTTVDVALPLARVTTKPPSIATVDMIGKERRSA